MGRSWSVVIMVLLSTLAALVILTHSAEEHMDGELLHQHEVSPRLSEPGSPDYDQSWRTVDVQPIMQQEQEPQDEWGVEIAPQQPPKRRRPGRKRKRRPQQQANLDDLTPEEQRPYYAEGRGLDQEPELTDTHDIPEPPRRRRKRPEGRNQNRFADEFKEQQRPLRRRGHRRKQRPIAIDIENEEHLRIHEEVTTLPQEHQDYPEENQQQNAETEKAYFDGSITDQFPMANSELKEEMKEENNSESDMSIADILIPDHRKKIETHIKNNEEKLRDKSYRVPYSLARKPEASTDHNTDLKTLLKQSGGLSLSELLQQRNVSLADLLNGKQNALSALKSNSTADQKDNKHQEDTSVKAKAIEINHGEINQHIGIEHTGVTINTESTTLDQNIKSSNKPRRRPTINRNKDKIEQHQEDTALIGKEDKPTEAPRRRLPPSGSHRYLRQRMRSPHIESTTVKIRPNLVPTHPRIKENLTEIEITQDIENLVEPDGNITTTKSDQELTTTTSSEITTQATTEEITTTLETTPKESQILHTEMSKIEEINTVKSKLLIPALRPKLLATNSELRRQANRHRKKKLRNKAVIPKNAEEIPLQDLLGMANLVSASEFITKIQSTTPTSTTTTEDDLPDLFHDSSENIEALNIVTDKMYDKFVKETTIRTETKLPKYTTDRHRSSTITPRTPTHAVTTEESAKEEILEVFKDMHGGARLAKILSERNMTIKQLVEHRERGSSQIHLADIFHNASREPNPPEPFLSKSLIEPISKETYPLRALLEANLHEPPVKMATQNPYIAQYTNIPLIVDYGRNINENGENLGIVALFDKFPKPKFATNNIKKDSEGTAYFTSVMSLNSTEDNVREGRSSFETKKSTEILQSSLSDLSSEERSPKDTISSTQGTIKTTAKSYQEQDLDGDGLIVLEDLQNLNILDNNIAQAINEKLEVKIDEDTSSDETHGFLGKFPGSVRSVTIASASILGLGMVLFLLTYIGCKWRQRRKSLLGKDDGFGERIPTPVFEHRKSNRNCSNRSISPMLASSNGFTMSTLDSQTGKESPDYMWDTLHKPFQ